MALDTKKAASFLKSGVTVVSVCCYRFVREHPCFSSLLCSFGVLYVCYPKVFFFLVSSSPVLVSTALLLGTLLSLGQPHIPQIDDLAEEEEENIEVSGKALEDDEDEKNRSNNIIKELSGDDESQRPRTDDDVVTDVPVTKVSRRRFEEGIDDVSTRGYIDAETLLGRRTEIVETIEEEEEQFNVEDLDDSDDRIRNDVLAQSVDFIPTHKREVEEVAAVENKEEATVIVESNNIVETGLENEQENMVHKEEISEKTGEEATLEGAEGHATECKVKKEETDMEDLAKSVNFSDTDTMIERSLEKPLKEIEEEMPLLGHLSSSTPEIHEEVFNLRTVDMDSSEGTSKSKGFNGKAEDTVEGEPQVEVSDDVEDNTHKASLENLFKLELRSSWKRFAHRHSPSDSGSDAAESLSSDASLGQLDPMFDEHHPLLAYEGCKAGSVSNSSVEEGFHAEDFSPREMVSEGFIAFPNEPQAPSDVHEEEEEEEEEEVPNDFGFTWTEDDEKNLRNLGQSERERMQQEERLIADLHVQHPQGAQEENLIDFYSEQRASFIEEENLVEIGVAGEAAAEKAIAIHSDSVDHQLEGKTDLASKEIPLEAHFYSTSREIPVKVQSDSGYEEATTEIQFDQVCKENPTELPEEKSLVDHLDKCMPNDLESLEDHGQPSGDAYLDETHQEMMQIEVSSIEKIGSASRSVIVEDTANNHKQIQVCSPKDSVHSIEKLEVAMQDSSTEFQMHGEIINADVASVEEERSKFKKNIVLDDDLSSSSSSTDEIEMSAPETTAEESETVHELIGVSSPKDSRHHNQDVEANEALSVPVTEIPRENTDTVEVLSTEEDDLEEEGKELSDDSSSSASEKIEMTTMKVMVEKSAISDEDIQALSPKVSLESTEMIEKFSQDSPLVTEVLRDDLTTVAEETFSGNQQEKMETVYDDSSSSASSEIDLATRELIAEESAYKHDMAQVESVKAEEQATETVEAIDLATREFIADEIAYKHDIAEVESLKAAEQVSETVEAIEKDSGLENEARRDMVSTEEQHPKEEKVEKHFDDSSSSASEETESTSSEFIQEELPSNLEEIHDISPKISHGSTEIMEAVDMGSLPAVNMLGDSLPTAEQEDLLEAQGSKSEEPNEPSDNLGFSATNIATSENQEGLIMLDVKSKEELELAFEHMVSNELDSVCEESHLVSREANQESTATVEQVKQDSTLQTHMPRDGFGGDASSQEQQPMPDETENTSDDSSSSASDIISFERLEELTSLEVNSKEQIEAALKEAIAEELADSHTHEEVEVGSSKASERPIEIVEPTKLDSPRAMDMQRNISPSATVGASSTEEHQSEPEKTEGSRDDLNYAEMEVRKIPSSDGGEIQ